MDGNGCFSGDENLGAAHRKTKQAVLAALTIFILVVVGVSILSSMNSAMMVEPETGSNALGIAWDKQTKFVDYADISSVEAVDALEPGTLVSGLEDDAVCAGIFRSEAFGEYGLYINKGVNRYIVVHTEEETLVLNGPTVNKTDSVYDALLEKISGK